MKNKEIYNNLKPKSSLYEFYTKILWKLKFRELFSFPLVLIIKIHKNYLFIGKTKWKIKKKYIHLKALAKIYEFHAKINKN